MDIVTIGEVLIDLTQTGRDERGTAGVCRKLPLSARWARMPLAAI